MIESCNLGSCLYVKERLDRDDRDYKSPHGPVAADLGATALSFYDALGTKSIWRGGTEGYWLNDDRADFETAMAYSLQVHKAQTILLLDDNNPAARDHNGVDLETHMSNVYDALPFTESERHWLIRSFYYYGNSSLDHPERSIREAARQSGPVLSAGRRQKPDGQGIIRRWYAWRRDRFEFDGQNARETARKGLAGMCEILLPSIVEFR